VTAAFVAFTLSAPLLARYVLWMNNMSKAPKDLDYDEVCLRFRFMAGLGTICAIAVSIISTVNVLR